MPFPTGPMQNEKAIYEYLTGQGFNGAAAAGIEGNIYQESHGNPGSSSGAGGGLFGEELQNGGSVSGGSLSEQLKALMAYIKSNGGSTSSINSHSPNASSAAEYFEQTFERAGIPDMSNRTAAAMQIAADAKSGNWPAASSNGDGSGGTSSGDIFSDLGTDLVNGLVKAVGATSLSDLIERAGLIIVGCLMIFIGVVKITGGSVSMPSASGGGGGGGGGNKSGGKKSAASKAKGEDYSDKPYKSEAGKRQYEEWEDRETEKAYHKNPNPSSHKSGIAPKATAKSLAEEVPF